MGEEEKKGFLPVWLTPALIKLVIEILVALGTAIPAMWPTIKEFLESIKGKLPELTNEEAHAKLDEAVNNIPDWIDS